MLNITPIKLLQGSHATTAVTGSGLDMAEDRLALAGRCVSLMLRMMDNRLAEKLERRVSVLLFQARTAVNHRRLDEAAASIGDALMAVLMANRYTSYSAALVDVLLRHIDVMLPQADEPSVEVKQRAEALVAVHNKHATSAAG